MNDPRNRRSDRTTLPKLTDRLTLGSAGLRVSPICLGMVSQPDAVLAAFDAGINFFFVSADMHWPLYAALRKGLQKLFERGTEVRDQVVVAGVSYVTQPEFCFMPFLELIKEVPGLLRLETTVMGGTYSNEFLTRLAKYRRHREDEFDHVPGVRSTGASFHDRTAAARAAEFEMLDVAFIRYNPSHIGAEVDLFPSVPSSSKMLMYNFKSVQGLLRPERYEELGIPAANWQPKATDYYRFALARPELDGLLCSPSTPEQVHQLAEALERGPLSSDEHDYLVKLAMLDAGDAELA